MVVSDGWERSDPALLGEQMARLSRLAQRVFWVNPRKAAPGFAPLTGGMAAALPHVDTFVSDTPHGRCRNYSTPSLRVEVHPGLPEPRFGTTAGVAFLS